MAKYLKTSIPAAEVEAANSQVRETVAKIVADVKIRGDAAVRELSAKFDRWSPASFRLSQNEIDSLLASVSPQTIEDIEFAQAQIRNFAEHQKTALKDIEIETLPGVRLGHRNIPVSSVGCYIPGGRYPMVASSHMTIVTAKVAGVERVIACTPPTGGKPHPETVAAMTLAGADEIYLLGGVQAVAAMALGTQTIAPVDMVVGAGNAYVAEAKRQLFGTVGIDLLAGPTEILIIADETGDPELIATDLAGQLEHGPTSVAWLITTSARVAEETAAALEDRFASVPTGVVAREAWEAYGEVVVCDTEEEAVALADERAAEHVEVHAAEPDRYLEALRNYGSLFLGDTTTVAYGDKGIGTNHVLPTARAARYTGGLWVGSFLRTLTYQRATVEGSMSIAPTIVAICEAEQLPGHARSARSRLAPRRQVA